MKAWNIALLGLLSMLLLTANYQANVNAQGPPPLPVLFNGNVALNGSPAPDGLNITAIENGQIVGSALTSSGQYALQVCGQPDQSCNTGDTVSFKLNGQLTASQTATFDASQRGMPQSLDLTFTGTLQQITTTTSTATSTTPATTVQTTSTSQTTTSTAQSTTSTSGTSSTSTENTNSTSTESTSSSTSASEISSSSSATTNSTVYPTGPKCLIATATYGSGLAPEVQLLRNFRDHLIMKTQAGSNFMIAFNAWYYSFSPFVANYIANHWVERTIMKGVLYPLLGILFLSRGLFSVTSPYPEFAALLSGLLASSLIGAFYLGLPLGLLRRRVHRIGRPSEERLFVKLLSSILLGGLAALFVGEVGGVSVVIMISSAAVVLTTICLSAIVTSRKIGQTI